MTAVIQFFNMARKQVQSVIQSVAQDFLLHYCDQRENEKPDAVNTGFTYFLFYSSSSNAFVGIIHVSTFLWPALFVLLTNYLCYV